MKKVFLGIFVLAQICNVKAFELEYSDWSLDYPKGINEVLIEEEDRYLCYLEKYENVEYLKKEDINDKLYDENDFTYFESDELNDKPNEYSEREIIELNKEITYTSTDASGFVFVGGGMDVLVSEIEVSNTSGEKIDFTINKEYLTDGVTDLYYSLNDDIIASFNQKVDLNDLLITFHFNKNVRGLYIGTLNTITSDNIIVTTNDYAIDLCQGPTCKLVFNKIAFRNYNSYLKKVYKYKDKLYKTYDIVKEYNNEYVKDCNDMIIDEDSKKTYYRYITNEYLVFDIYGNIVTDNNYCVKSSCFIKYVKNDKKDVVDTITNPQTYDPLYDSIVIFVVSAIVLTYFIVERRRLIKKSSNVESILKDKKVL